MRALLILLPSVGIALAASATPDRAAAAPVAPGDSIRASSSFADSDRTVAVARVRAILDGKAHDYAAAEREARSLYARETAAREPDSVAIARAADLIVESIWRGRPVLDTDALALAEQARGILERRFQAGPDLALSLYHLGNVYRNLGQYGPAQEAFERCLDLREHQTPPDTLALATALNAMGNACRDLQDAARALPYFRSSLSLRERILGPDHTLVGMTLSNTGNVLRDLGDLDEALPMFERSVRILEANLAPDNPVLAIALNNLGNTQLETGHPSEGLRSLRSALQIILKNGGPVDAEGLLRGSIAGTLEATGDHEGARREFLLALAKDEKAYGPNHDRVAFELSGLGNAEVRVGMARQALLHLRRSLRITEDAWGSETLRLVAVLDNMALAEWSLGDDAAALETALRGARVQQEQQRRTIAFLPERRALEFAALYRGNLDLAISIALTRSRGSMARPALDALIHGRCLVLDEMARRHRLTGTSRDSTSRRLEADYAGASERLATLLVRSLEGDAPPAYRDSLTSAQRDRDAAESELALRSQARREARDRDRAGVAEVAAALPRGSALVSFVRFDRTEKPTSRGRIRTTPSYAAWVTGPAPGSITFRSLGPARVIDSLVASWQRAVLRGADRSRAWRAADSMYARQSAPLRAAIWDPLAPSLRGATRVFFVPDGSLNLVDFASLPVSPGRYLVEQAPLLHYLTEERDVLLPDSAGTAPGLLAFGNPDFDTASAPALLAPGPARGEQAYRGALSDCPELRDITFRPLPSTQAEVDEVREIWSRGDPAGGGGRHDSAAIERTGADASEEAFKQDAPRCGALHLATHAFVAGGDCGRAVRGSRGIGSLIPAEPTATPATAAPASNPLRLSGIVFAGANRHAASADRDDGILTAEEIAALDLSGVGWAALSACDTGVGDVRAGEGVLGLRRAFAVAGARTLITSLRAVEDAAAQSWMRALYEARWRRGLGVAEAVRAASLEILRVRRSSHRSDHPFYWSGFIAMGDWR